MQRGYCDESREREEIMDHEEPRECYEKVLAKKARSAKRSSLVKRSDIARK